MNYTDDPLIKQKRLYTMLRFIDKNSDNDNHINLIIDIFLKNNNNYMSLFDITNEVSKLGLNVTPEFLKSKIEENDNKKYFNNYQGIESPFKLESLIYQTFLVYQDYTIKLEEYVNSYLIANSISTDKVVIIIDILLETLFVSNIEFINKLLKKKAKPIEILSDKYLSSKHSTEDYELYNNFIINSDEEFNDILHVILLKFFDFLKFHYNPNIDKTLSSKLNNVTFFLDSSFIIRLFGLHGGFREDRAKYLINALKNVEGINFKIHKITLQETEHTLKEIIKESLPLLKHSPQLLKKITSGFAYKNNEALELYLRLYNLGLVYSPESFQMYYSNTLALIKKIIGDSTLEIDYNDIKLNNPVSKQLLLDLQRTERKSNFRIEHISKLINYIAELRMSNNFNIFDIKKWLITTDKTSLQIDNKIRLELDDGSKSVCVLPTELLRIIGAAGDIQKDYMDVFKRYIIHTPTFKENYSEKEIETIDRIATLCEKASLSNQMDVDFYFDRIFETYSLNQISRKLKETKTTEESDDYLVSILDGSLKKYDNEKETIYKDKYLSIIDTITNIVVILTNLLYFLFIFSIPIILGLYLLKLLINPNISYDNPLTYIDSEKWNHLEGIVTFFEVVFIGGSIWLYKKTRKKIVIFICRKIKEKF